MPPLVQGVGNSSQSLYISIKKPNMYHLDSTHWQHCSIPPHLTTIGNLDNILYLCLPMVLGNHLNFDHNLGHISVSNVTWRILMKIISPCVWYASPPSIPKRVLPIIFLYLVIPNWNDFIFVCYPSRFNSETESVDNRISITMGYVVFHMLLHVKY